MTTARTAGGVRAAIVFGLFLAAPGAGAEERPWAPLGDGLELGRFPAGCRGCSRPRRSTSCASTRGAGN